MSKELTPLEALERVKSFRLSYSNNDWLDKEEQDELFGVLETALKNYEELTSKPVILYGRTHGHTQSIIDTICKNYKEVKITNLEDEKKLKALEVIKELLNDLFDEIVFCDDNCEILFNDEDGLWKSITLPKDKYNLLKEVLTDE